MINIFKQLFQNKAAPDSNQLIREGGIIIDVRTKAEYAGGHIQGSLNIPL